MHTSTFAALSAFPLQLEQLYASFPDTHANWASASWDGIPRYQVAKDRRYPDARGVTNTRDERYLAATTGVPLDRLFRRVEGVGHDEGRI